MILLRNHIIRIYLDTEDVQTHTYLCMDINVCMYTQTYPQ